MKQHNPEAKICSLCGRKIEYRNKWARDWNEIKFCSDRCRRDSKTENRSDDEGALLSRLKARGAGKTICPSEILADDEKDDAQRMERVRQAARRLVHSGKIVITQKGKRVDPGKFRGPIRLKLA